MSSRTSQELVGILRVWQGFLAKRPVIPQSMGSDDPSDGEQAGAALAPRSERLTARSAVAGRQRFRRENPDTNP